MTKYLLTTILLFIFALPASAQFGFGRGSFEQGFRTSRTGYQNPKAQRAPTPEEVRAKKVNDDIEKIKQSDRKRLDQLDENYRRQLLDITQKIDNWNLKLKDLWEGGFDENLAGVKEAVGYIARLMREKERLGDTLQIVVWKKGYLDAKRVEELDVSLDLKESARLSAKRFEEAMKKAEKRLKEKYAPKK